MSEKYAYGGDGLPVFKAAPLHQGQFGRGYDRKGSVDKVLKNRSMIQLCGVS